MLGKAFAVVATLVIVKATSVTPVVSREDFAAVIEGHAEGIAATFGKDLVLASLRMVSPDGLPETLNRLIRRTGGFYHTADCASLGTVDPTVGAHGQVVYHRVGIFEPEAFEMDLRRSVGFQVAIEVRVVEQVGRVQDPCAAVYGQDRRSDV